MGISHCMPRWTALLKWQENFQAFNLILIKNCNSWHYSWCYVVLTDRNLHDCLLRGSTQQVTEMQITTAKYWMEVGYRYGRVREGLKALKEMATPQVEQQCQLNWNPGSYYRLSHQPKNTYHLEPGPQHICNRHIAQSLCGFPSNRSLRCLSSYILTVESIPQQCCLAWPQCERLCLILQRLDMPG